MRKINHKARQQEREKRNLKKPQETVNKIAIVLPSLAAITLSIKGLSPNLKAQGGWWIKKTRSSGIVSLRD